MLQVNNMPRRIFLQTLASSGLVLSASSQAEAASVNKVRLLATGSAAFLINNSRKPSRRIKFVQVFVAGASGGSGKLVVQQLAAKGIAVRAGVRVSPLPRFLC